MTLRKRNKQEVGTVTSVKTQKGGEEEKKVKIKCNNNNGVW